MNLARGSPEVPLAFCVREFPIITSFKLHASRSRAGGPYSSHILDGRIKVIRRVKSQRVDVVARL